MSYVWSIIVKRATLFRLCVARTSNIILLICDSDIKSKRILIVYLLKMCTTLEELLELCLPFYRNTIRITHKNRGNVLGPFSPLVLSFTLGNKHIDVILHITLVFYESVMYIRFVVRLYSYHRPEQMTNSKLKVKKRHRKYS